jgi:hypothetical protein
MKKIITASEYFYHPYNGTVNNERCIEIPLAERYIKTLEDDIIEIGAVSPYYRENKHKVYDPYDTHPKSTKLHAEALNIKSKNILSISTIEHFGNTRGFGCNFITDEKFASQNFLEKLVEEAASFFVSVPIHAHPIFDIYIKQNLKKFNWFSYVKRQQFPPIWELCENESCFNHKYASPFECANAVIFLTKGVALE